jgi:hypoxanthine-DNA glycosylase
LTEKSSFAPVVTATTRVLVCGSLPGEASLAARQYYAHPTNQFWRLIGGVTDCDLAPLPYLDRLAALAAAHVGLWDTIATARRSGSLDTAIRDHAPTALADLVATLPALRAVAFNGGTSARIGFRQLENDPRIALVKLPSSSAAYCRMTLAQKQAEWNCLRIYLR